MRVGQLTLGHAKLLKGITDPARLLQMTKEIIARGLSVRDTEAMLKQSPAEESRPASSEKRVDNKTAHVQGVEDELRQKLGLRIEIRVKNKDRGQIVLAFENNDDFERLLEVLRH